MQHRPALGGLERTGTRPRSTALSGGSPFPLVLCAALAVLALAATTPAGGQTVGPALDVDQTVNRSTVTAGEVVGVNVTLNASAPRFEGPGLNASLPVGWTLVPETADGGDYKPGTTAWVWLGTADTKNVSYAVPVPASAAGTYALTVRGSAIDTTVGPDGRRNTTAAGSTVTVNGPPDAGFVYAPSQPAVGATVSFNDTSTDDGTPVAWSWEFGDGTTATGENVSHSYAAPGTYAVNLTVTDDDGATDTVTRDVPVGNDPPTAAVTYGPSSPVVGEAVSFDGTGSTDADGSIASYAWSFGDGASATGPAPTHDYESAGSYTVTLTVTDDDGASATATATVTVDAAAAPPSSPPSPGGGGGSVAPPPTADDGSDGEGPDDATAPRDETSGGNRPPVAAFDALPGSSTAPTTVTLDASASRDPDGSIVAIGWDVDDDDVFERGGRLHEERFAAGDHRVTLRVTDDDGAVNTTEHVVALDPAETVAEPDEPGTPVVPAALLLLLLVALALLAVRYGRRERGE